ncbi:metal ABC transporter permease [Liberibacter sp. Z1]|nr:metal ABC transporter permease [Candidatus Liberibacter sp.]
MINTLLEPFSYSYMNTAIWIGTLVGCIGGSLSAYLILKGWSSIGSGISHAIFPGIVFCYQLAMPFSIGAIISGILAIGIMLILKETTKIREDAAIAVVFVTFFSFAMFILSLSPSSIHIENIFLGNILSISKFDCLQVIIMSSCVLVVLCLKWKDFVFLFFDENYAYSLGLNIKFLKILFFTLLTISIVSGFQTVGILLVIATIIMPGATAYLFTKSFGEYIILSSILGATSSFLGAYLSYFLDCSPGGSIVMIQTFLFLLSLASRGNKCREF